MVESSRRAALLISALLLLLHVSASQADDGVVSGFFRGNEAKARTIGLECDGDSNARFLTRSFGPVTASASGEYRFSDTGHHYDLDTQLAVYTGFHPIDPTVDRVGFVSVGTPGDDVIALDSGTQYVFVVQACGAFSDRRGGWSFTYSGPGSLTGPSIFASPAYTTGTFDGSDPSLPEEVVCGVTDYQKAGPIRVPRSGEYVFSDSSVHFGLDISLAIYQGSFDPAHPRLNLLAGFDDGGTIKLQENLDYYFVVQPLCDNDTGDFSYVLMGPSGVFQITEGLNGAWANGDTLGQGMLMEVYPDVPLLFAAWFTWDTTQPGPGESAEVGDPNHRWLTAQGGYQDDLATLDLNLTTGGIFDDPAEVATDPIGSMEIRFTACNEAEVSYDFGTQSGAFVINRLADDNNATCEALMAQQKVPVYGEP